MKIKVLVFDDNQDRRDSLAMLIESADNLTLAGIYDNAKNALEVVKNTSPDVILMDIGMPGVSGIEATRLIKQSFPEVQIIIQTVFDDHARIFEALKAGASGYLLKSTPVNRLLEAISDAADGGAPITPSIASMVISFFREKVPPANNEFSLSDREKEVLGYLVDGMSYKMIASQLNISYFTVNSHIKKIYEKLHVHSVGEAVSKAIQQKIVNR